MPDRREFLKVSSLAMFAAFVQQPPTSAGPLSPASVEDVVAANRILADQGILDAFGHVSVRHERNPERFVLSRSLAPALITAADLIEYDRFRRRERMSPALLPECRIAVNNLLPRPLYQYQIPFSPGTCERRVHVGRRSNESSGP